MKYCIGKEFPIHPSELRKDLRFKFRSELGSVAGRHVSSIKTRDYLTHARAAPRRAPLE